LTSKADRATIAAYMTSARRSPVPPIVWLLMAPLTMMALEQEPPVSTPDPAPPTAIEQALIEHNCGRVMTDAHQQCLSASLASMRADFGRDLTRLSTAERRTLDAACNRLRTEQGRDAYLDCLGNQLVALRNRRRPAKSATPEVPALPPPSTGERAADPVAPARPASSWSGVWIGGAAVVLLAAAAGAFLVARTRRARSHKCRVCGEDVREAGDMCQTCRHEAADTLRRAATERADQERAQQEEQRRRQEEEEQRRLKARQEEEARLQQQEEARQREEIARQQEEQEAARRRSQPAVVAEDVFDPYAILGVSRDASKEAIDAAYVEAKSKYDLDHVSHLGVELQQHYKGKAEAVDRAYQILKSEV
jgi:hypothetical protein